MKKILTLLAVAALSACQTPTVTTGYSTGPHRVSGGYALTPYRPYDSSRSSNEVLQQRDFGGYTSFQLGPGVYRVGFLGGPGTPRSVAKDSALYRAAEVTLNSGYRYFTILESKQDSDDSPERAYSPAATGPSCLITST
jgi:hypothetical protein